MKDKIKIIVLISIFIILLFLSNNILKKQENQSANKLENIINTNEETDIYNSNNLAKDNKINNLEEENMSEKVLEVTIENFEKEVLESEKTVLVDFYAEWCGPCKRLSPIVEEVASEETEVKFVKMNIDNCEDIAIEYQVMSIPTLVVMKNGKEVNRSVGLIDKEQVKELIK